MGKMEDFLNWEKRPFVDQMLDNNEPPYKVCDWMKENGFSMSYPTLYNYAKKRKQAAAQGVTVDILFYQNKRKGKVEKAIQEMGLENEEKLKKPELKVVVNKNKGKKKKKQSDEQKLENQIKPSPQQKRKIHTEMEMLDLIIQKAFDTVMMMEEVQPETALKAIKLKHEITGGEHKGFTIHGLEEIRRREEARMMAIENVLLKYIPEEKWEEVLQDMERTTMEYYKEHGLLEAYQRMKEQEGVEEEDDNEDNGDIAGVN